MLLIEMAKKLFDRRCYSNGFDDICAQKKQRAFDAMAAFRATVEARIGNRDQFSSNSGILTNDFSDAVVVGIVIAYGVKNTHKDLWKTGELIGCCFCYHVHCLR